MGRGGFLAVFGKIYRVIEVQLWGDCLFNSEPNKKLRLTPPLARDEQAFEFGSLWFGVNRVERVERVEFLAV